MKARFLIVIVLLLGYGSLLAGTRDKGAKELFFDPLDGAVVNASPPLKPAPKPPRPTGKSGPERSTTAPMRTTTVSQATRQKSKPDGQTRSEIDRRSPSPTNGPTLGLSYWIELVGQDGKGQQVTDHRIFRSGEKIRLHFSSNADGNIALIQLGSSGTSSVLFPDPAKGLNDSRILAREDRILPKESAWFRFDNTPGIEKILVVFARSQKELDIFSIQPSMDATATKAVLRNVDEIRGGKDLILETETENVSEVGSYGVNLSGKPVVMEIQLKHQ
jgi:Domain of unknown function (DUF4384)